MNKMRYGFLVILILVIVSLYFFPTPQKEFDIIYEFDSSIRSSLSDFRQIPLHTIDVDGVEWTYYYDENEAKPVLFFIHGMGGAYDLWWQQIVELKDDFGIISITLPAVNSLEKAQAGILAILENEDIAKISIIGTSMGGYIAQYIVDTHPEKIEKAVFGNTFPPNDIYKEQNGRLRKLVPFIPEWIIMSIFRNNIREKVLPASNHSKLVEAYLMEQYYGLMSKKEFIGRLDIVLDKFELNKSSSSKDILKLIIESDNDPLVPPELRQQMVIQYPEAEIVTSKSSGHFTYLNEPDLYLNYLKSFLLKQSQ